MAARAFDLALFDGMMRLFICLRPDIFVTFETEIRLFNFEVILSRHRGVDGMAVVTCHLHGLMLAQIPEWHAPRTFVARETFRILCIGIRFFAEDKNGHSFASTFIRVLGSRTMA
jgi:hypothetical protein